MASITIKLPSLHADQLRVVSHPARFKIVVCGRRWGKTFLAQDRAVHAMLQGQLVGYFAPDYKKLSEVYRYIEKVFKPMIKSESSTQLIESSNKTEGRIELKTGGIIEFWSMVDPDCGRSRKYHLALIDEAGLEIALADRWREAIRATLMDYQGVAYFLGTPKPPKSIQLKDYGFYRFYQRGLPETVQVRNKKGDLLFNEDGSPKMVPNKWKSFHAPSSANPTLRPEEIVEMRNEEGMTQRIARQEIDAEFLSQNDGAMWTIDLIEKYRGQISPGVRIVSTVLFLDPGNITTEASADMTGIVVVAKGDNGHYYVLNDLSGDYTPYKMAHTVVKACEYYGARLYFESNQGGQYIKAAIQNVSKITCTPVPSTQGKEYRADAPLALYEMGLVHHVAEFVDLEGEMVTWNPHDTKMKSPNRMDALVGAINVLAKKGSLGVKRSNRLKKDAA